MKRGPKLRWPPHVLVRHLCKALGHRCHHCALVMSFAVIEDGAILQPNQQQLSDAPPPQSEFLVRWGDELHCSPPQEGTDVFKSADVCHFYPTACVNAGKKEMKC